MTQQYHVTRVSLHYNRISASDWVPLPDKIASRAQERANISELRLPDQPSSSDNDATEVGSFLTPHVTSSHLLLTSPTQSLPSAISTPCYSDRISNHTAATHSTSSGICTSARPTSPTSLIPPHLSSHLMTLDVHGHAAYHQLTSIQLSTPPHWPYHNHDHSLSTRRLCSS